MSGGLWMNRYAIGAIASHTGAPAAAIVATEGGGQFNPTLSLGGGVGLGPAWPGLCWTPT